MFTIKKQSGYGTPKDLPRTEASGDESSRKNLCS